ncbi:par A family ATPase/WD repeat iron cluster assembly fusion protein [Schizosaccharomyces cryophilus OY26]|uniref:Probable cytosolic iron-sulfur protein assembly protein 1 n=1 Tax=Schizosaccharomyces cryophilus (strain OY26 / ATCC MYA-4695 / CBS 11777 / NBRC 106824 / NRRL Y48691) TaxID=653667 RepID=S9XG85_SCHCR|nr:par A family ATPase/WD repeat iron cluster assembly fusion protein [Schizosaccharomyces cryophilus OY26]EPY52676.1 par A family ATPase/WD repeat iron cluster assembly fusion protein [Schizosaccharomyces cryophilus OY26]
MDQVRHVILVLSGKGGVGKSSVTTQLALSLHASKLHSRPLKIGILDIDLTGPSIPRMFGKDAEESRIRQSSAGWIPVYTDETKEIGLMSLGFLLPSKKDSVVWRGPKKAAMIRQFVSDVHWGELDYLIIDTPPGTGDEHLTIVESLMTETSDVRKAPIDGAVMVTTPQALATLDVQKEIDFCKKADLRILGIVENMSGFICPHCADCTNIFSSGGGSTLAEKYKVPFLGSVPIDPKFGEMIENQNASTNLSVLYPETEMSKAFFPIVQNFFHQMYDKRSFKLVTSLGGHDGRIWSVDSHPVLPLFASGSQDKTVRIYNSDTLQLVHVIDGFHSRSVRRVAWRPVDRPILAAASFDATISINEKIDDDWECTAALEGHENEVKCIAWSPGGNFLATCSRDKSVWIWETTEDDEFDCMAVLQEHTQDVKVVAWHPTEDLLVSGSYDDTICFWRDDGDDWALTCQLQGHESTVWALAFSPSGSILASADNEGNIILWTKTFSNESEAISNSTNILRPSLQEEWIRKATLPHLHQGAVYSIAWINDQVLASGGSDGKIIVYESEKHDDNIWRVSIEKERAHDVYEINSIAWLGNDKLVSGGDDGECRVWHIK